MDLTLFDFDGTLTHRDTMPASREPPEGCELLALAHEAYYRGQLVATAPEAPC